MILALVTGSTGLIGRSLVETLLEAGLSVRAFVRPSSDTMHLRALGVDIIHGGEQDLPVMRDALDGVQLVYHLAAYLKPAAPFQINGRYDAEDEARYQAINVDLTAALLEASLAAGVERFVFASSNSVYSLDVPVPTPEDALLDPASPYGRSKVQAERLVSHYQERGLPTTIVRPGLTYGPGDRNFMPLAMRLSRLPLLPVINGGRGIFDMLYVRDAAQLFWLAGQEPAAAGRIYNCGPGRPLTVLKLLDAYRQLTGRAPRVINVSPAAAARTAWLSRPLVRPFIPEADVALTRQGIDLMSRDLYLDTTRAVRELGFRPQVDLVQGLALTLESL